MPVTYKKIASATVTSATQANIEFTSIPQTYTDLVIKISGRTTRTTSGVFDGIELTFNGTTTGYSERLLYGDGSSALSASQTAANLRFHYATSNDATASTYGSNEIYIPNYTGNTNKSVSFDSVSENNATAAIQALNAGLWSNTAAITSIKLDPNGGDWVQHSTAVLYGISKS